MKKQTILFAAHCILNTASKVVMYDDAEMAAEEALRRRFVHAALDAGVQIIQLPCPEFTLYGARRWGHTADQFDNPFFRAHCRALLSPALIQAREYIQHPERFSVLGFLGVDGSPSCGVKYSCEGAWGGNLSGRQDLSETIASAKLVSGRGTFFRVLEDMLLEEALSLPLEGLFAPEPERAMGLIPGAGRPNPSLP